MEPPWAKGTKVCSDHMTNDLLPYIVYGKYFLNPIALRKAKIVCNFGLSECDRVKHLHCLLTGIHMQNTVKVKLFIGNASNYKWTHPNDKDGQAH